MTYTPPIRMKRGGILNSPIPGRADKIPVNVPAGSYVLPADIPSALGQGNSMAGAEILKKMFSSGPYGLPPLRSRPRSVSRLRRAAGGQVAPLEVEPMLKDDDDERVPIIAAGGEFILHPEVVRAIGDGSMHRGNKILDRFVLDVREKHIETLQGLEPPNE